jgi:hypothetical protein
MLGDKIISTRWLGKAPCIVDELVFDVKEGILRSTVATNTDFQ